MSNFKTRTKIGRESFIEYSLNYICLLFNDIQRNDWNPEKKERILQEIYFRMEELKTIFTFTLTDYHFIFVTYADGVPLLVTEDIDTIAEKTGFTRKRIVKARSLDKPIENFTFDRLRVADLHFVISRQLKEYSPPQKDIENETD